MNLVEALVAASLFLAGVAASLQLWAGAGGSQRSLDQRQHLRERIERDRLVLQSHWRLTLASASCPTVEQMLQAAVALPPAAPVERQAQVGGDGQTLQVLWPAAGRQRWYTAAGLGLCPETSPLTDSQLEGAG